MKIKDAVNLKKRFYGIINYVLLSPYGYSVYSAYNRIRYQQPYTNNRCNGRQKYAYEKQQTHNDSFIADKPVYPTGLFTAYIIVFDVIKLRDIVADKKK